MNMRVFNFLLYLDFINMNKKKIERRVFKVSFRVEGVNILQWLGDMFFIKFLGEME